MKWLKKEALNSSEKNTHFSASCFLEISWLLGLISNYLFEFCFLLLVKVEFSYLDLQILVQFGQIQSSLVYEILSPAEVLGTSVCLSQLGSVSTFCHSFFLLSSQLQYSEAGCRRQARILPAKSTTGFCLIRMSTTSQRRLPIRLLELEKRGSTPMRKTARTPPKEMKLDAGWPGTAKWFRAREIGTNTAGSSTW